MYLGYLLDRLEKLLKIKREIYLYVLALLMLSRFVHAEMVVVGYLCMLMGIKRRTPKMKDSSAQIQVATALIVVCLISSCLQTIALLNYFNYLAYATKIISMPFTFMLFQPEVSK